MRSHSFSLQATDIPKFVSISYAENGQQMQIRVSVRLLYEVVGLYLVCAYIYKCKNIFTNLLKDVSAKSIETSSKCMQAKAGDDRMQQSQHA